MGPQDLSPEPPSFRLATLNMWCDDTRWEQRLEATALEAAHRHLDVLLLQEVVLRTDGPSRAELLARRLGWAGLAEHGFHHLGGNVWLGNAVLTRTPMAGQETVEFDGMDLGGFRRGATMAWWDSPAGNRLLLGSVHLAWGGEFEGVRYDQGVTLDQAVTTRLAAEGGPVDAVVVGGDFNCTPDSDTVRWFVGLEADRRDEPTQWTDAWSVAADPAGGATVSMQNPWAAMVARAEGIDTRWGPPPSRRDYVLTRGWAWGRTGGAMEATVAFDRPVEVEGTAVWASDHYGVAARLIG